VGSQGTEFVYEEGHFFSAKDLCYIEYIPALVDAGATVFKIEGRRRPPEYVEVTSRCYREALDAYLEGTFSAEKVRSWTEQLTRVHNRGFCKGFLYGTLGPGDSTLTLPANQATRKRTLIGEVTKYDDTAKQAHISLTLGELAVGEEVILEGSETYCHLSVDSLQVAGVQYRRASVGADVVVLTDCQPEVGDKVYAWRSHQPTLQSATM
jgi:putative protease